MNLDSSKFLKHISVDNPQLGRAPLDGKEMPLVDFTAVDGTLYRVIGQEGSTAHLRELTARELVIVQNFARNLADYTQEQA